VNDDLKNHDNTLFFKLGVDNQHLDEICFFEEKSGRGHVCAAHISFETFL